MRLAIVTVGMVAISRRFIDATAASCTQSRDTSSFVLSMCIWILGAENRSCASGCPFSSLTYRKSICRCTSRAGNRRLNLVSEESVCARLRHADLERGEKGTKADLRRALKPNGWPARRLVQLVALRDSLLLSASSRSWSFFPFVVCSSSSLFHVSCSHLHSSSHLLFPSSQHSILFHITLPSSLYVLIHTTTSLRFAPSIHPLITTILSRDQPTITRVHDSLVPP
jgi:hypothetical protein